MPEGAFTPDILNDLVQLVGRKASFIGRRLHSITFPHVGLAQGCDCLLNLFGLKPDLRGQILHCGALVYLAQYLVEKTHGLTPSETPKHKEGAEGVVDKIDSDPAIATWELWMVASMLVQVRGDGAEAHAEAQLAEAQAREDDAGEIVWSGVLTQLGRVREQQKE